MYDRLLLTISHLEALAPAPRPWRFDTWSALIGAAAALLLVGLAYVFRDKLRQVWEAVQAMVARVANYLMASAEENYRSLVVAHARTLIIPPHLAPLDAVFVEPSLLTLPAAPQSTVGKESLHISSQTIHLRRILGGHNQVAILGAPGVGRTTALVYLALISARLADKVGPAGESVPEAVRGRLPLYVRLSAMDWSEPPQEEEEEEANQEKSRSKQKGDGGAMGKLLSAAVAAVGGSGGSIKPLRQYLEAGKVVVLADGWDELLPSQHQPVTHWLTELLDALPGNMWVVSTGTRNYAPLAEAGFVPMRLLPWDAAQVETFAKQWADAYELPAGSPPVSSRELVAKLQYAARSGASPMELALRTFVYLSDRQVPAERAALFDRALELLLQEQTKQGEEEPWLSAACRTTLGQIALALQQEERMTVGREEIEAAIEATLPPPEERPARATARVFRAIAGERGVLRSAGSGRYAFIHPLWQAYLAARQLVAEDPRNLIERLEDPQWADALCFYAELGDMTPLVAAWLRTPGDLFHTRLRTLSDWVRVAPKGSTWRDGTMAVLARAFIQPGCPASTRLALAEALAETGVPGIAYFLKQTLQHPDPDVRIAAVTGLAKVAQEADISTIEAVLEDQALAVREAAVRALVYPGIDAAKRLLGRVLLEADDELRPVAAEALAKCGEESQEFLSEVVETGDVMTRRAAVYGLAQVGARDLLEKIARDDEQWIVRSAAEAGIEIVDKREKTVGVPPVPEVEQLPWLISWAAARGQSVGLGEAARQMLSRALREGDSATRLAAAQILIHVGRPEDVEPLRSMLVDPDPVVANTALEALAEIGSRYNLRIEQAK